MILKKHADWAADPKMAQYLRPETLFAPSHFESYLNQPDTPPLGRAPYMAGGALSDGSAGDEYMTGLLRRLRG